MFELNSAYLPSLWAMLVSGLLVWLQLLIADLSALKTQHIPGAPIEPNPKDFVFRAARAHANTNESIACFILFIVVGVLANADSLWLNCFAWLYVFSRMAHMSCYYLQKSALRSLSFGISLTALLGLLIIDAITLIL